jgi:hypothetical protein
MTALLWVIWVSVALDVIGLACLLYLRWSGTCLYNARA